jgi:predicted RNA-binding Zn-ribbon protein involved in translation (DUF1610 family)
MRKKKVSGGGQAESLTLQETNKPVQQVEYVCPKCGFQETISEYANPLCGGFCNYTTTMVRKTLEVKHG